jgi:hypothetical protein
MPFFARNTNRIGHCGPLPKQKTARYGWSRTGR